MATREAQKHGVKPAAVSHWIRRKFGSDISVLSDRKDGLVGCSVPCVFCARAIVRLDLKVHVVVFNDKQQKVFHGRLTDAGAPSSKLTSGQRKRIRLHF